MPKSAQMHTHAKRSLSPLRTTIQRTAIRRASLFVGLLLALPACPALAGTVYCSVASKPAEFAICNSEELQVLDGRIEKLYDSQYAAAASFLTQASVMRDHRAWLNNRNDCRSNLGCLEKYYRNRLSKLSKTDRAAKTQKQPIAQFTRFSDQKSNR